MRTSSRQWSELTGAQRLAVVILGGVEIVLTAVSLADLVRRPAAEVRGPKTFWALAVFVQPVGPIAYLIRGRRGGGRRPARPVRRHARSILRSVMIRG